VQPCCAGRHTAHNQLTQGGLRSACHDRCNTGPPALHLLTMHDDDLNGVCSDSNNATAGTSLRFDRTRCCCRWYLGSFLGRAHRRLVPPMLPPSADRTPFPARWERRAMPALRLNQQPTKSECVQTRLSCIGGVQRHGVLCSSLIRGSAVCPGPAVQRCSHDTPCAPIALRAVLTESRRRLTGVWHLDTFCT
jgi:hypothetical protein